MSLLFEYVFKFKEFDTLASLHNRIYCYLGSSRHSPVSMSKNRSKSIDDDVPLSFMKIADVFVGGKFIALLLMLWLRDVLVATIHIN